MSDTLTPVEIIAILAYTGPITVIPRGVSGECREFTIRQKTAYDVARKRRLAKHRRRAAALNPYGRGEAPEITLP